MHDEPVSSRDHPSERRHQTHTEPRIPYHQEPKNYFYEHPAPPVNEQNEKNKQVKEEAAEGSDQEKSHGEEEKTDSVVLDL